MVRKVPQGGDNGRGKSGGYVAQRWNGASGRHWIEYRAQPGISQAARQRPPLEDPLNTSGMMSQIHAESTSRTGAEVLAINLIPQLKTSLIKGSARSGQFTKA